MYKDKDNYELNYNNIYNKKIYIYTGKELKLCCQNYSKKVWIWEKDTYKLKNN